MDSETWKKKITSGKIYLSIVQWLCALTVRTTKSNRGWFSQMNNLVIRILPPKMSLVLLDENIISLVSLVLRQYSQTQAAGCFGVFYMM